MEFYILILLVTLASNMPTALCVSYKLFQLVRWR